MEEQKKWVHKNFKCGHDPAFLMRDKKYDAYFCGACDAWIEKKCRTPSCKYCSTRPDRPSEVR